MGAEPRRFFVLGAQRCGTTLLHRALHAHPQVAMNQPVRPEPKPFLSAGSEHIDRVEHDQRWFRGATAPVLGVKTTTYLERSDAAGRILECFPDARFVVVVRDPVERALSNFRLSVQHGLETLPVDEALTEAAEQRSWDRQRVSTSPFAYLRRGHYAEQLDAWAGVVGRGRLLVVRFEDLIAGSALADVQEFLGLDPHPAVVADEVVNPSRVDVSRTVPESVRRRLSAHFAPWNRRLQRDWGVVTTGWAGSSPPGPVGGTT